MAKGGDFAASDLEQGEGNIDLPMTICPNQSVLVNELKSKFDAIDQRFDTLFQRLNGNGNNLRNSSPKPVISNSESQIIYNQISEVLEQWTGRHTQNYYELKLMSLQKISMKEMDLILSLKELGRSWQPVKCLRIMFVTLCLVISMILVSVSIRQKYHFAPLEHFEEVADLACEVQLSGKEHPIHQTTNNFYQVLNLPSLNSAISLDKAKILECLSLSSL